MLSTFLLNSFILQAVIIIATADEIDETRKRFDENEFDSADLTTSDNLDSASHNNYQLNKRSEKEMSIYDFLKFVAEAEPLLNQHNVQKRSPELIDKNDSYKQQVATNEMFSNREARGATREQWIKQPYPVDFQSKKSDDNDQRIGNSKNEDTGERAPRVHFVTNQKRLDASESRNRFGEVQRTQSSATSSPRTTRMYESHQAISPETSQSIDTNEYRNRKRSYQRDYNRYDLDPTKNPTSRYNEYDMNYKSPPQKKQQRIIYYATLPEVVRTPPNVDLRYRSPDPHLYVPPYNYYNRGYYDGKVTSPHVSVADYGFDSYDREGRYDVPSTYIPRPYHRRYPLPPHSPDDYGIYHPNDSVYGTRHPRPSYLRRSPYVPKDPPKFNRLSMTDVLPSEPVNKENMINPRPEISSRSLDERHGISDFPVHPPVKISTSVNVKEIENTEPERRVYARQERDHVYENPRYFG